MISPERLRQVLHYDPETGDFSWLVATSRRVKVGDMAGSINDRGYLQISIDGHLYKAHRLAWLYVTSEWPKDQVDHRDLDRANNRWDNLREATGSENKGNTRAHVDNMSGFKGVSWDAARGKWLAQIKVDGKNRFLGRFTAPEDAHAVYASAAANVFGQFARTM